MLRVVHHVRGQGVEGQEVSHLCLLLAVLHLDSTDDVGRNDLVSWHEKVLHLFISVVELNCELPEIKTVLLQTFIQQFGHPEDVVLCHRFNLDGGLVRDGVQFFYHWHSLILHQS